MRKGKFLLLVGLHLASILMPVALNRLGVEGMGTRNMWFLYGAFESAVLFYGADFFAGSMKRPYLANLVLHFALAIALGPIFLAFGTTYIFYHDGSCLPMGGPILILFPETILENLPILLAVSLVWVAIRWMETTAQVMWFRRNLKKSL